MNARGILLEQNTDNPYEIIPVLLLYQYSEPFMYFMNKKKTNKKQTVDASLINSFTFLPKLEGDRLCVLLIFLHQKW